MKKQHRKMLHLALWLAAAFILWTCAVCCVDVQPIGPRGSWVGLAAMNGWFHQLTGVHMFLYAITDWLELVPFGFMLAFALLGLLQWVRRKKTAAGRRRPFAPWRVLPGGSGFLPPV